MVAVRFRRTAGMLPLPKPVHGGDINSLKEYVNVTDENDFILLVAFLLAALEPNGPFPISAPTTTVSPETATDTPKWSTCAKSDDRNRW